MTPVGVAVVGAGLIGKRHIERVLTTRGAALAAIVDPSPEASRSAAQAGVPHFRDLAAMLAKMRPDAAIVATPNGMHVAQGLQLVAAGVPALIEKPLADDVASATALVEAGEAAGVPVLTGHHRRHNPLVHAAKAAIDAGRLGRIVAVHGTCWFHKPPEYFVPEWRRSKGAGPVLVNLIHDVDLLRHLCGEIAEVQAIESSAVRGHTVEDTAAIILRFASGALGTLTVSDTVTAPWSWEFTSGENPAYTQTAETCTMIGGTKGSLTVPYLDLWTNPAEPGWWEPLEFTRLPSRTADPLSLQVRNLVDVVRGAAPLVTGREGLNTLRVVAAIKQAADTGPPNTPMTARTSIATVALSGTLADKLEAAASAGFDGVEIMEADLLAHDGTPAEVRRMAEDLGLTIDLYQPFRDFEAMPDPQRARNLDRAERKFDIMQALGAPMTLVCSNTQPAAIDDDARAAADLRAMAERAAARGLRVGFEALSWGRNIRLWSHAWRIVQMADHPALGLIVDSFHTLALNDDPSGIAQVPGDRLFFVQLADAPRRDLDVLTWSRHDRNFPGQGDLDVDSFVRAVLASGYQGPLSLEVFNDDFRAAPSRTIARDGLRSLILTQAQAGAAELPPISRIGGVEFLEFAVDASSGTALAEWLTRLGFHLAGRHRSKDVTLYRQGRLKLVLNAEQDSAAAEHFQHHGPSVCALALRVSDPTAVEARARRLLVQTWLEPTGPGERRIPAVRGPDGTLIYVVDDVPEPSFWADDFDLLPHDAAGAGLEAVDHLALALMPGQMDTFVLFWRGLFGLQPQPVLDVPDPFGLIRSRAMVNPEGTFRVTFNVSDARESATNRFVAAFSGAGVHHVALAATDAAKAAAALRAAGAEMLAIPPNYYEDLQARTDLDDTATATLSRLGLLYDRDPAGEFRHAYTEPFQDRFFFEIVERTGYTGFGAINAPVRMAAQARRRPLRTWEG